jgi:hypothetical protein
MGDKNNPYLYRWTFLFFNYSIRIHHWIGSDDTRFFHDHSSDSIAMVVKGYYYNVIPKDPSDLYPDVNRCQKIKVQSWRPWFVKATKFHYLEIPSQGAWTILFQGKPYNKWGFMVHGKKFRPLRYFHKFKGKTSAYNSQLE